MEKTALDRVLGYIAVREARPVRQMDDCIHGIHAGEDFEGFLNYSDIKAVVALLHDTVESLDELLVIATLDSTDTYCEDCLAHAPKNIEGEPIGPIPHKGDCPIQTARLTIAKATR